MPVQPSYPGVYVQEVPSGVRTIAGVSTSITVFIGRTEWGPVNMPVLCTSYTDYVRAFTASTAFGDLARAVRLFFLNGGSRCYVLRIGNGGVKSSVTVDDAGGDDTLIIRAKNAGALGDQVNFIVTHHATDAGLFNIRLYRKVPNGSGGNNLVDDAQFNNLSMNPANSRYAPTMVNHPWAELVAATPANNDRPITVAETPLAGGGEGTTPLVSGDYDNAYTVIDKELDLFNLLVLARSVSSPAVETLWDEASIFCQKRRAFLLMDPPAAWTTAQEATNNVTGVNSLRTGVVTDHSAVFFPRLVVNENGVDVNLGPSGAVAGLMARIDGSRGVWKAPAGTEADLRGVNGLQFKFTDQENGVMNPRGINVIRIFPNGIVNWGARTLAGDDDFGSEYKYIPIRRTALFIEESLYRGLKWVVFEPNDEPLWAQIRLNVGAFMHNLFRQGAFQGRTKQEAYFVKCDSETTTQNDINLGMVNIWVGFAPLKPAEFVVLYLQQMTGQIQV